MSSAFKINMHQVLDLSICSYLLFSKGPGPPSNVTISEIGETTMTVTWEVPIEPNGIISAYEVCMKVKPIMFGTFTQTGLKIQKEQKH